MKFDLFGIILMAVAIWVGTMFGSGLASWIGFGGGIVGALIVGFIVYVIYTIVTGGKIQLMKGAIFAVLVYIAQLIAGLLAGYTGIGGGIIGLIISAFILSLLWGWFGGKGSPIAGLTSSTKTHRRGRRKRR